MNTGQIVQLTDNTQMFKGERVERRYRIPEATRRAFLAVVAAIKKDHPEDFPKLLREAIDLCP